MQMQQKLFYAMEMFDVWGKIRPTSFVGTIH